MDFSDYQYKVYFYYLGIQLKLKYDFDIRFRKDWQGKIEKTEILSSQWLHLQPLKPVDFIISVGMYGFEWFESMMLKEKVTKEYNAKYNK